MNLLSFIIYLSLTLTIPFLLVGCLQKVKARLQNRIGPPLLQPFHNFLKCCKKNQIISEEASFLFRFGILLNFCIATYLLFAAPWLNFAPVISGLNLFFLIYLLAAGRFFSILSALDTGSPFGTFSGSREAALAFLVEPSMVLCLIAPCLVAQSNNIGEVFSFSTKVQDNPAVWLFACVGLFLVSLVELSRMPIDDPTTHLELTMVHEAMIIEASGRNLAMAELGYAFKLTFFFGLCVQCAMHVILHFVSVNQWISLVLSVLGLFLAGILLAILETVLIKLKWTKCPDFIAYAMTMGLFACIVALGGRT